MKPITVGNITISGDPKKGLHIDLIDNRTTQSMAIREDELFDLEKAIHLYNCIKFLGEHCWETKHANPGMACLVDHGLMGTCDYNAPYQQCKHCDKKRIEIVKQPEIKEWQDVKN